jgi:hypothetical protein
VKAVISSSSVSLEAHGGGNGIGSKFWASESD